MSTRKVRVIVVDDDPACRVLAALLLERAGYAPVGVATVSRALEQIDEEEVDLVVTDLMLPGRTGVDLLEALREGGNGVPAIVLTASDDGRLIDRVYELGARAVVRKPYTFDALRAAAYSALEHRPAAA
jgi:DNA-binding response OmpR family regulator